MGAKHSVEIVIPCLNEEVVLEENAIELHNFMKKNCAIPWKITIFSNGSTDNTVDIGTRLSKRFKNIKFLHIPQRGRAKVLRMSWLNSNASIVGYMDADLSTGLGALPKCLDAIINQKADIAIGNRLAKESQVERSPFREFLSRGYNLLILFFFPTKITDAQCGFKFFRAPVSRFLLPHVHDNKWFFDTENLLIAERCGFSIAQIPVEWVERKESKVRIRTIVFDYIFNLIRMRYRCLFSDLRY
jgi:glycosyltransferase involved in cell wall biosynthesis